MKRDDTMLNDERDAREYLRRVTYKPNSSYSIADRVPPLGVGSLSLSQFVPNACVSAEDPEEDLWVHHSVAISFPCAVAHFRVILEVLTADAERHEQNEWLKVDGVCVCEPHPDLMVRS